MVSKTGVEQRPYEGRRDKVCLLGTGFSNLRTAAGWRARAKPGGYVRGSSETAWIVANLAGRFCTGI